MGSWLLPETLGKSRGKPHKSEKEKHKPQKEVMENGILLQLSFSLF